MPNNQVDLETVRLFCAQREVELVLVPPPPPFTLCFRGEFEGYGEFFWLLVREVAYVEIASGATVGDLMVTSDAAELARMAPKWAGLGNLYPGTALVLRSADAERWETARSEELFVIVADQIIWRAGKDWQAPEAH